MLFQGQTVFKLSLKLSKKVDFQNLQMNQFHGGTTSNLQQGRRPWSNELCRISLAFSQSTKKVHFRLLNSTEKNATMGNSSSNYSHDSSKDVEGFDRFLGLFSNNWGPQSTHLPLS